MSKVLKSLAFKLGAAVFITASVTFSGLGVYYTRLFSQQIDAQLIQEINFPSQLMNRQALPYYTARDLKALSALVGEQVLFAAVNRADGKIHYATDPEKENRSIQPMIHPLNISQEPVHTLSKSKEILYSLTPLYAEGNYLGNLYMAVDIRHAIQQKRKVAIIFSISGLLCTLITTFVGAFLVRRLTLPRIVSANRCLLAVANGDYSVRIRQVKTGDELSALESGINHTVQQLEERKNQDKILTADLKKAKEAAEQANRSKSRFLANMSHEIRTPMNGILGMAQIMEEMPLTADQTDCIEIIKTSGEGLMKIINDILDLSRIEMGTIALQDETVCIRMLLSELDRFFTPAVRKKGLDLYVHCGDDVPQTIRADEGCLKQVLINLIANAIKFTHNGHVDLSVSCPEKTETQCTLTVNVKDTGIGMTQATQEIIFNEFAQADDSHTREYGGTGLGLSISKRMIERMGGSLTVNSQPNHGATFSFTVSFPIADSDDAARPKPDESAGVDFILRNNPHVLIVEDNRLNQKVISKMLENTGCHIKIVENGELAVQYLRLTDPPADRPRCDAVLMDIQMPVMDGLQATEMIRQTDHELPIIALTAHAMKGDREKFIEAKMNDYLAKPIQKQDLLGLLERYTSKA